MNQNILYYGSATEPPQRHLFKVGHLSLLYENGFIRHIYLGENEVLSMIYFALRDDHWATFHGSVKNEVIRQTKKGFNISYRSVISERSVQYVFDCTIRGNIEGKIEFEIRGESYSTFRSNRIGFCILHPVGKYAGKSITLRSPDSSEIKGVFPVNAAPHQPFINIRSMQWEPANGWQADVKFEGDIFEMEDQRNWSDHSYKTYCTPLSKPFPVEIKMGDKIRQKVILSLTPLRKDAVSKIKTMPALSITVGKSALAFKLPQIGLGDSQGYPDLTESDIRLFRALEIGHLRGDIVPGDPDLNDRIKQLKLKISALTVPLILAIEFGDDPEKEIYEFIQSAGKEGLVPESVILFLKKSTSIPDGLIQKLIESLRKVFPGIKTGTGSNRYFAELNRERVDTGNIDFLVFPSSPQSHLVDNMIIIDNIEGASGAYKTAVSFSGGKPVYVSPVSLRVRTTAKPIETDRSFGDHLPGDVDAKQSSLLGASWTLGSIKYLAESGAGLLTYFETTGWKGVIQGKTASPAPSLFYAQAGTVFPVYFVFYWLGKLAGAGVIPVVSSDPAKLTGLALELNKEKFLLLANHSMEPLEFPVNNFKNPVIISRLNEKNAVSFMNDPIAFFEKKKEESVENTVRMMPFEVLVMKAVK